MADSNENNVDFFAPTSSLFAHNSPFNFSEIPNVMAQDFLRLTFESYGRLGTLSLEDPKCIVYAYYSNGPIRPLERQKHSVAERKYLNKHGLKIFLTEPLCSHIVDDPKGELFYHNFNFGFYSEFYNKELPTDRIRSKELDSIWKYVRENALTNVTVATCDYNVEKYYTLYKNEMTIIYDDLFLRDMRIYDNITLDYKKEIKKRTICPTWRYTTARWLLSSILHEQDCYLSWYFAVGENFGDGSTWARKQDFDKWAPELHERIVKGTRQLNRKLPLCLDIEAHAPTQIPDGAAHHYPQFIVNQKLNDGMNPVAINEVYQPLDERYQHTFLSIQAESRFAQPTGNWSEKVIQAIQHRTPFIIVAPPFTLQCMKEAGYRTFDKWWDESYDTETNHLKRFKKIVEIIDWVETKSYEELFEIYQEMFPVLEHNFWNAVDNTQTGTMSGAADPENAVSVSWDSEWSKEEFEMKNLPAGSD